MVWRRCSGRRAWRRKRWQQRCGIQPGAQRRRGAAGRAAGAGGLGALWLVGSRVRAAAVLDKLQERAHGGRNVACRQGFRALQASGCGSRILSHGARQDPPITGGLGLVLLKHGMRQDARVQSECSLVSRLGMFKLCWMAACLVGLRSAMARIRNVMQWKGLQVVCRS